MRKALTGILLIWAALFGGAAQADGVVIAALGDSLTQGYGLQQKDGFVPQLENWLHENGAVDVTLINAGVSGDTTAGGLSRIGWTLEPQVDALIVTLGGNDLLRGLDPAQARSNIEGILQAAQAAQVEVLLIGMQAPGNFGPEYKADFDALYPELAQTYGALFLESFFIGLSEDGTIPSPAQAREWFQDDGIHPNPEGVLRIVEGIGPQALKLIDKVSP
ncbi:arylesterase [Sulfitobacter sp. HNIBRBA2951]|uniref:arylesterase n=1 Tax=Sulfitobacter aquimarinus TaxID=3158557 RepID=UPI0032DF0960